MAKLIRVNTTLINLDDIILLCMNLWTLYIMSMTFCQKKKMLMTSDARKIKVSNVKGIKVCLSHYKMRLRFYGGTYNSQDILGYCLKSV